MPRVIADIAKEIVQDWKKPYFGAVPYLDAMHFCYHMKDMYGLDSAQTVVTYFLANAQTW